MLRVIMVILLVFLNLTSFALMAIDKKRAQTHQWRVPERVLFLATAVFGGLGGTLGMFLLHHKTKHWYFRVFFPLFLVLQIALLVFLFKRLPG